MPPSALGSASGLRRISSFVKPGRTSPAVARAVHQLAAGSGERSAAPLAAPPSAVRRGSTGGDPEGRRSHGREAC